MPAKNPVAQYKVQTRSKNKDTHPGAVVRAPPRRPSAEVQKEHAAKAQEKKAREEEWEQNIQRAAEFERADMANEDIVDATPRPSFNPKPWPPARGRNTKLAPVAEVSGHNDEDTTYTTPSFRPSYFEQSVAEDGFTVEGDSQPAKNTKITKSYALPKGWKAVVPADEIVQASDEDVIPASDEETPKPKKVKRKVRDEINVASKEMELKGIQALTSSRQVREVQPWKALKREGAIADITKLYKGQQLDQPAKRPQQDDNNQMSHASQGGKRKREDEIKDWTSKISTTTSKPSSRSVTSRAQSTAPSLTGGSSRSSAPSVLTDNVKIIEHQVSKKIKVKTEPEFSIYLDDSNGGLSDNDELKGEEREAAIASPPKGNQRPTSEKLIVQTTSKATEVNKKPIRSKELPEWIDGQWFRYTFVSSYMAFVGQTANPWEVPSRQSITVMQKIWDAKSIYEYEITESSTVYRKTVQRLADSWRNVIGSTGIAVVLTFCEATDDLADSDAERIEFAKYFLDDFRFLFQDAQGDDKTKWKGAFRGPFVLQTFASHLSAIDGIDSVPNLHDKPPPHGPIGALALAAASVERALALIASGTLTIAIARTSRKNLNLPCTFNYSTGKDSTRQTGFSDTAWGNTTRAFAISASSLTKAKFQDIIKGAEPFMNPKCKTGKSVDPIEDKDERACIVISDDE